jgi:hypothetical protein
MSPIAGFTRFRQWAFSAAQSAHGTAATPSGAFPWRGTPDVNPNWTDIDDVDVGSIDPVLTPYRMQMDTTATLEGPLDYNSLPVIGNAGIVGAVAGSAAGTVITWAHTAKSLTATTLDEFSASWGDDFAQDDMRFKDGILEQIEFSFDESLGPWRVSTQWYFGSVDVHVTRPSVTLASNLPLVFGADTALYINNTAATIGTTQLSDALHSGRITITNTIDKKRFANGSNSRFAVAGYGLAERTIEAEFTFAKTAGIAGFASTSEMRQWLAADPVTRYISVVAISRETIPGSSTAYSWTQNLPLTWRTRGDGELGGNSTITLMGEAKYDPTLLYPYKMTTVNGNATLP